jgi:hypothetical protein
MNKREIINDLDSFTRQYIDTALWSSTDSDDIPLDRKWDAYDMTIKCLKMVINECKDFQKRYGYLWNGEDYSSAGHNFWLTRNGHGAGFWDSEFKNGMELSKASKVYGCVDLTVYNGKIHCN